MSRNFGELLGEVLDLPEADRVKLAELVLATLNPGPGKSHPSKRIEILRRVAEVDPGQGGLKSESWQVVRWEPDLTPRKRGDASSNGTRAGLSLSGSAEDFVTLAPMGVDEKGRLVPISEEERKARLPLELASLQACWEIPDDETDTNEGWGEVLRNLGVDPVAGQGLES